MVQGKKLRQSDGPRIKLVRQIQKCAYLWSYKYLTKNLDVDPQWMDRWQNCWQVFLQELPVTANKYDPVTMSIELPPEFMSPSASRDQAITISGEILAAHGYDPADLNIAISGNTD